MWIAAANQNQSLMSLSNTEMVSAVGSTMVLMLMMLVVQYPMNYSNQTVRDQKKVTVSLYMEAHISEAFSLALFNNFHVFISSSSRPSVG